ncbi:MAG: carbohydrate-binding family 9-like protein [Spirochaetales bacterium]|nr:carbohydrate-binding family 9-like protein [Spirochaetales bacterium]
MDTEKRITNFPYQGTPGHHLPCSSGQLPYSHLPPVAQYTCRRTDAPITIDGVLDEEVWSRVEWSDPYVQIDTGKKSRVETKISLLWDDEYLYAGYKVEDHDIRGTMGSHHDHIYMNDNDVEIFVGGDGYYYEMGLNPINNMYELKWTWLQPLVEQNRFEEIEELMHKMDYLYYEAREGDRLGRIGDLNFHLPGLKTAVYIDGTLNRPDLEDRGWTVEFALPWKGLSQVAGGLDMPPKSGDILQVMGYRMDTHWDDPAKNEASTWNAVGCGNIHIPERWSNVTFSDEVV